MNGSFYLQLVNPSHPAVLVPDAADLLPAHPAFPDILLERYAALALRALLARLDAFSEIVPVSGFRTLAEQQKIWDDTLRDQGPVYTRKFVAVPGCSEHQTGLAIDLAANRPDIDFICPNFPATGVYQEFRRLAPEYGFVLRYPKGKEHLTQIACEPWHFRYVGTPHAAILTERGLVLEEYLEERRQAVS
ncbi:MAG: D-alanyl-D-alanine carboxypeptidase family protein [Eubacteriales bacterium]|nr:D-alanyl-D-alanine carboxypeptidase family protein [Eubacteriales bacterium]